MALTGNELVVVRGVIGGGPSAQQRYVTTQNIANLDNGGVSTLSPTAVVVCYGPSGGSIPSSVPFATPISAVTALGSIAPSTLAGTELINVLTGPTGGAPPAYELRTTTLNVANA